LTDETPKPTVTVVGIGNILMLDDGIGPALIHRLEQVYEWGPDVELLDAGAPGMELAYLIEDRQLLIIVDAIVSEEPPATLHWYDHDQIVAGNIPVRVGPHDPGIREAILKLELIGHAPKVVELLGVVPENVDLGSGLTEGAKKGVLAAEQALLERMRQAGAGPISKREGTPDEPWWQSPAP
jgi:hydrogenase maturation protease